MICIAETKLSTSYSKLLINHQENAITIPRMTEVDQLFYFMQFSKSANLYLNSIENVTKGCWKKISFSFNLF